MSANGMPWRGKDGRVDSLLQAVDAGMQEVRGFDADKLPCLKTLKNFVWMLGMCYRTPKKFSFEDRYFGGTMRTFFSLLLGLSVLATSAVAEDYIKISAWNIENLGSDGSRQSPAALAQHIQLLAPDAIALQEIYDTDGNTSTRTNEQLDRALALVSELPGHTWTYVLFEKKDPTETHQHTGLAWNTERLQQVGSVYKIDVVDNPTDGFDTWKRHPHAIMLSAGTGKTDLVLISLHMKANTDCRSSGTCDEWRQAEAEMLIRELPAIRSNFSGEEDIVLIGDSNMRGTWEAGHQLFESAGFNDLNSEDSPTYAGSDAPFDRIFVPRGQPEFRWSRQYILSSGRPGNHESSLSDHHMIAAMVRILDDDD